MPEHVSILQLTGVVVLALATAIWLTTVSRILRRSRYQAAARRSGHTPHPSLPALPNPREAGPQLETVELTPAEQAAFAGLVRQLSDGR